VGGNAISSCEGFVPRSPMHTPGRPEETGQAMFTFPNTRAFFPLHRGGRQQDLFWVQFRGWLPRRKAYAAGERRDTVQMLGSSPSTAVLIILKKILKKKIKNIKKKKKKKKKKKCQIPIQLFFCYKTV
jgi:hypothetical protein